MDFKKKKRYRYVILKERQNHFGQHNGYTKGKPKVIYAESRQAAKTELSITLRGKQFKLLLI